jgi:hypothetical protein
MKSDFRKSKCPRSMLERIERIVRGGYRTSKRRRITRLIVGSEKG